MDPIINKYLESLELGELKVFKNMAIVPLFAPADEGPEYLTMQEALDKQLLEITEVSESGSVPDLKVTNSADQYVLLLDGEELMGAKQNRVLTTTILLKPQSETVIPVSCTEQGRWAYSSREFSSSGHMMSKDVRLSQMGSVHESLRLKRGHRSDQGAVWGDIRKLSADAEVASPTSAMRDVYESKADALAEYQKAFESQPKQHGMLVFINGEIVGFDIVSRASAYQKLQPKLLKSYAIDAMFLQTEQTDTPSIDDAKAFLVLAKNGMAQLYPSVGHGDDYRVDEKTMVGSALVAEKSVIHVAFFRVAENDNGEKMAGVRQRRAFRSAR
ncbi:MAG: hypothetical protein DRR08_31005 [Candidatus Parabeggiatoa sp. nov. 2]|nr:MAG: hypothetical protein B6247_11275 [Beggiatoa sp. 4572_84]RKZ49421.1 MAG: hypothetical protein DRR08_31005 [Gammaproteobacteria bacterium]